MYILGNTNFLPLVAMLKDSKDDDASIMTELWVSRVVSVTGKRQEHITWFFSKVYNKNNFFI